MRKQGWILLLCLLLVFGVLSDRYGSTLSAEKHITVTAPFHPLYTPNQNPQSSVDQIAEQCGISQFQKRYGTSGAGQKIALIDSGIALRHSAFQKDGDGTPKVAVYRDYTQEGVLQTQPVDCHGQSVAVGGTVYTIGQIPNEAAQYRFAFLELDQIQPRLIAADGPQIAVLVTAQEGSQYNCVYLDTNRNCDFTDEQPLRSYTELQQSILLQGTGYQLDLALTDITSDGRQIHLTADTLGHGTFLAGLMAADSRGYQGLAPKAQLYVYKIFDRDGQSSQHMLAQAIRQAIQDEVHGINLSLSIPNEEPITEELEEALYLAQAANIPVIAAAGNYGPGKNTIAYPARHPYVIGVGSYGSPAQYMLDQHILLQKPFIADYSGRGKRNGADSPLVVAPAGMISTVPAWYANTCMYDYGTSISAAITTAAICHVQEAAAKRSWLLSTEQMKHLLANWASDLSFPAAEQGYGSLKLGYLPRTVDDIQQRAGTKGKTVIYTADDLLNWRFSVPQGQSQSWYVDVPVGCKEIAAVLQVDQQASATEQAHVIAMGRCRVSLYNPDGILMDQTLYLGASYGDTFATSDMVRAILPQSGIWELVVTSADNLSLYNHLESTGVLNIELK